jgi:hypothetical protein
MPRMTPQEAGRRGGLLGGKSRSAKKLAAALRNGFQKAPLVFDGAEPDAAQLAADHAACARVYPYRDAEGKYTTLEPGTTLRIPFVGRTDAEEAPNPAPETKKERPSLFAPVLLGGNHGR